MYIEATDPETGEIIQVYIADEYSEQLEELSKERVSDRKLHRYIDNLDIPADAKMLLISLKDTMIKIGEKVVSLGKKLLEVILVLVKNFPNTAFGTLVAFFLGLLVSTIPVIGVLLALIVKPLLLIFGLGLGAYADIRDQSLKQAIDDAAAIFSPLKGAA